MSFRRRILFLSDRHFVSAPRVENMPYSIRALEAQDAHRPTNPSVTRALRTSHGLWLDVSQWPKTCATNAPWNVSPILLLFKLKNPVNQQLEILFSLIATMGFSLTGLWSLDAWSSKIEVVSLKCSRGQPRSSAGRKVKVNVIAKYFSWWIKFIHLWLIAASSCVYLISWRVVLRCLEVVADLTIFTRSLRESHRESSLSAGTL